MSATVRMVSGYVYHSLRNDMSATGWARIAQLLVNPAKINW
jgi:hypothetical protein